MQNLFLDRRSLSELRSLEETLEAAYHVYGDHLANVREAIKRAAVDPNGPMTAEQRGALFAGFKEWTGTTDRTVRMAFTAAVLGPDVGNTSWSATGITAGQASRLLDVIAFVRTYAPVQG